MSTAAPDLLTGATGPLGAAVALELLSRTTAPLYCLLRVVPDAAGERLRRALRGLAAERGLPLAAADLEERCIVLAGDVTDPGCGLADGSLPTRLGRVWHCAEDARTAKRDRGEIELCNVRGTANVAALARLHEAESLNHFSTTAVAGNRVGKVAEAPIPPGEPTNNVYEQSKLAAEALALDAGVAVVRLFRVGPTIAAPGADRSLNRDIAAFAGRLLRFTREVHEQLGDYFGFRRLTVSVAPEIPFNLVPMDLAAARAVDLGLGEAPAGPYHLTAADPPTLGRFLGAAAAAVGILEPRFSDDDRQLNRIDEAFSRSLRFYHPAWLQKKEFEQRMPLAAGLTEERLREILASHLAAAADSQGAPAPRSPEEVGA